MIKKIFVIVLDPKDFQDVVVLLCLTWQAAPGAVDVPQRLLLGDGSLDFVQHQIELFGAFEVLLLSGVQTVSQRQKFTLVNVYDITYNQNRENKKCNTFKENLQLLLFLNTLQRLAL